MDHDGGDEDEQGSGWCKVKKKHRSSSSKISIQKVTGDCFQRIHPSSPCYQVSVNENVLGNSLDKQRWKPSNMDKHSTTHLNPSKVCASSLMTPTERCSTDEEVANKETGSFEELPTNSESEKKVISKVCASSLVTPNEWCSTDEEAANKETGSFEELPANSESEKKVISKVRQEDRMDSLPKIKWGNLDDDVLKVPTFYLDLTRSPKNKDTHHQEVENSVNDDISMPCNSHCATLQEVENSVNDDISMPCSSHCSTLQEGKGIMLLESEEQVSSGLLSSSMQEQLIGRTQNEPSQKFSEETTEINCHPNGTSEKCQCIDAEIIQVKTGVDFNSVNAATDLHATSGNGMGTEKLVVDHDENGDQPLKSCKTSEVTDDIPIDSVFQENVSTSHLNFGDFALDGPSVSGIKEDENVLPGSSVDGADVGYDDSGESKERFRERLWCFLFENLNRAVDELYLLCELECDVEQMDEAILVVQEAASDFKELKTRVENFDSTKRSPSHSLKDGSSMNVKAEHRRPHALSWEVRRMTTSPRRAEVLSSSLEAFKKIQLERGLKHTTNDARGLRSANLTIEQILDESAGNVLKGETSTNKPGFKLVRNNRGLDSDMQKTAGKKQNMETTKLNKPSSGTNGNSIVGRVRREPVVSICETEKQLLAKDKASVENRVEKHVKSIEVSKKLSSVSEKEKEKRSAIPWKSMDAWKEKRNWEEILQSPLRSISRISHSPGLSRKEVERERARVLHDKLMSPEKKKKSSIDIRREAEEKHARAMRIRTQLEAERVQKLQKTSEKLNRVNELHAVRNLKLREGMHARQQRSESRHGAYLAQVARRAGDESHKVNEVRFITSLNEENKKLIIRQKLHDSEMRRAEKLQVIKTKQKEDMAREEAVTERRKLLEAERLQRLAEIQRKKEEAQVRREEEIKASNAAREAKAVEQFRRKEVRAKAQQEEAELLALKLSERLRESEHRRKYYLEQIREKASMDFRDQSSPLHKRSLNKDGPNRSVPTNAIEDFQHSSITNPVDSSITVQNNMLHQSLKKRIKRIRQRLMALKHDFPEPLICAEINGIGQRAIVVSARAKIGRWLQDLQRLRQARKEGATSIGLIVGDMIKFLEGKDAELHAARQVGLLDFLSSALPASHTSKAGACQVTIYLLRLLRIVLSLSVNQSYFLAQNFLPPIIPMLSASLEMYIKIAASSVPGSTSILPNKSSIENLESIAEVLDGFFWIVTAIIGHAQCNEQQRQMQNGLMELIVAYQIIHRLRDFFALYDRPQVEGSPFPASILLSLNLLVVLTSRHGIISYIDWESCTSRTVSLILAPEPSLPKESEHVTNSCISSNPSGIVAVADSTTANISGQISDEENLLTKKASLSSLKAKHLDEDCEKDPPTVSLKSNRIEGSIEMCPEVSIGESQNIAVDKLFKVNLPQKDDVNFRENNDKAKCSDDHPVAENDLSKKEAGLKQSVEFLLSVIAETSLVSLPSLLTAVLLQANNRISAEQASYILPMNFEEVATGVLKILNNLALLDLNLLQNMLARSDLRMEFFHLMSFLLSHCSNKWKAANDQVGLLLLECLLLLGYFALFHSGNQAVLRWGKSPTILHKVCDLPFVFFSDPELTPILAGSLISSCYGCEQNMDVVLQELSMEMLLSLIKSCRQGPGTQSESLPQDSSVANDSCDNNQFNESRKVQFDGLPRTNRKSYRTLLGKASNSSSIMKAGKPKTQRENRGSKTWDEWAIKHNFPGSGASSTFMLHRRFPNAFLVRAEDFFSTEASS